MITNLKASLKLSIFIFIVLSFFSINLVIYPFYLLFPLYFRKYLLIITHYHAKALRQLIGLKIKIQNMPTFKSGTLIVSNHLSYLDVLSIMSIAPSCFVTSIEIKKTLFLGDICRMAGCLFVERRNKKNINGEISEITQTLKNGENVVIFPEATSTNGEDVLRFKRPLFKAAINSQSTVQPICINYTRLNNQKINLSNRDKVFWYGDMAFFNHFFTIMKYDTIDLEINFLKSIRTNIKSDHNDIAEITHHFVKEIYQPIIQWM